jgi:pyruvate/2-oxoglutarate dehydrogenase complex dihydrolipoamide dehydrogenase (E3) component
MTKFDFDIGIIGGGAAGLTVAAGAAQLGAKTLLVEKAPELGGDCLHFGCVPSKTLIKTARVYHHMKNGRSFGLPQPHVDPVDYREIRHRIQSVISAIQHHDSVERFCGLGAKVEFGIPEFADDHCIQLNGRTLSAKYWVIATGSSPASPPIEGIEKTKTLTNRDIFSLDRLPGSMISLGAGPVGAEMAQAFCRLGTRITLVQRGAQILSKEDRDMADEVMDALKQEGVTVLLKSLVLEVKDLGREKEVRIMQGESEQILRAEEILVAAGRRSNTESLSLEKAGVELDKGNVRVDGRMRTNRKHIFAAGDVTGKYQFTHAAGYEGGIVISNAVFHLPRKADYTFLPWCTYTDPELASIGMNEKRAEEAGLEYSVWHAPFAGNDRSLTEGERRGRIKLLLGKNEKPVGVQIFGPRAGEIINEWVAVLNGKMKLSTLAMAVHPYPTLGEINKKAAGEFLSGKIFSERMKKGLRFFFNLKGRACG